MSDVPVTAWRALALALATFDGRAAAFAGGLAAGLAVLTRPNLVPLLLLPVGLLWWRTRRSFSIRFAPPADAALFCLGALPACIAVAVINTWLYGSPLESGYGPLPDLYSWNHLFPNLQRYPVWMVQIQTPIVVLALLAPLTRGWQDGTRMNDPRKAAIGWLVFALLVFVAYLFYLPFEDWWFLRFVLPALPPVVVLTAAGLLACLKPLGRAAPWCVLLVAAAVAWNRIDFSVDGRAFEIRESERRHSAIGQYVARKLPANAVLISMQHSGSARYYSGRLTLRYDHIPGERMDWLIAELQRLGHRPYILLEEWEVAHFQRHHQGRTRLAALNWPPIAMLNHSSKVRIYDVADQEAAARGQLVRTEIVN